MVIHQLQGLGGLRALRMREQGTADVPLHCTSRGEGGLAGVRAGAPKCGVKWPSLMRRNSSRGRMKRPRPERRAPSSASTSAR